MTYKEKVKAAEKLVDEGVRKYPNCGVALSFGKDSIVLMHLVKKIYPRIFTFAVLSDTEFSETLKLRDKVVAKWKLNYKEYNYRNVKDGDISDCCRSQKVKVFKKAVKDLDMWFSGIRKSEGVSRANFRFVEKRGGLIKINPILDFTETDIWKYTAVNSLPVNPLYGEGYRSLSCKRCSVVEKDEREPERAGRWAGTINEGAECGIHTQILKIVV